jgi:hypothetical protein
MPWCRRPRRATDEGTPLLPSVDAEGATCVAGTTVEPWAFGLPRDGVVAFVVRMLRMFSYGALGKCEAASLSAPPPPVFALTLVQMRILA